LAVQCGPPPPLAAGLLTAASAAFAAEEAAAEREEDARSVLRRKMIAAAAAADSRARSAAHLARSGPMLVRGVSGMEAVECCCWCALCRYGVVVAKEAAAVLGVDGLLGVTV
jgi:hypothetical protein